MPAQITTLIDKVDSSELLRDELAAILLVELAEQQSLATLAGKDPGQWVARIFIERSNPWSEFIDEQPQEQAPPIVNVSLDNVSFDGGASNIVERQKATGTYFVDCYGYGISEDDGASGHIPGDARAAMEAQRAVRLVRNIIMSASYTYLGHRGLVWRRWIPTIQVFQPQLDSRPVPQVVAARVTVAIDFNEFSPQVEGQPLELVSANVLRKETGELYLRADYDSP